MMHGQKNINCAIVCVCPVIVGLTNKQKLYCCLSIRRANAIFRG